MSQIIWLASYPKSGSTWLRTLFANYQCDSGLPADINALGVASIASKRELFDEAIDVDSSDLTPDEIDRYRPAVYRRLAAESCEALLLKIHDAYTLIDRGEPLIPSDVTRGAIYLLRNPLDVAVSFSYHTNTSIQHRIECMADETFAFSESIHCLTAQLRQKLLSWSGHVMSWVNQTDLPVQVIRYEDLLTHPIQLFDLVLRFIGWEADPSRIERAVQLATFANLQAQERERGFKEKPLRMETFFRQGKSGSWRAELNEAQVACIVRDHGAVMQRFGYLSATGNILC